ncbi:MAG: helix-turn-helix transcriptional regulator [Gammaproteobacteria bacterium]|nr:helix-turn-helix transcriptional regulator [Gammaproteobacteria bacterium]
MQRADVSKSELASRLGRSKGYVSQLFSGSRNMTLRTLANIATALDCDVRVSIDQDCESEAVSRDTGVRRAGKSGRVVCTPRGVNG